VIVIVHPADCPDVTAEGYPLVMKRLIHREHSPGLSVTWIRIWGDHRRMRTDEADRAYYVIEGDGAFQVGDEPEAAVGPGDAVLIPKGVAYSFSGHMTYLVMNGPAFRDGSDVVVD
jgi:mannose-6-phosphate isomerase-like protein (cupin superfamily)